MGNNLLSACKNTTGSAADTNENKNESNSQGVELKEKKKILRKGDKIKINSAVHAALDSDPGAKSRNSDFQSQQSDLGNKPLNGCEQKSGGEGGEMQSAYPQAQEDIALNMSGGGDQSKKQSMDEEYNHTQVVKQKGKSLDENVASQLLEEDIVNDAASREKKMLLKNNTDGYFTQEDLIYYQKYKKEKTQQQAAPIHKDKNIRWQQGEVLGSGSFGKVILGMNIDTGEFMAVKQVHIGSYNQDDRNEKIQQIQSEIEALQNFSDKHIVRYIGVKQTENSINIFLEYVPGGSISSLLYRYNKFNETLIRKFITQILKGLEYLHAHNIIHRDIKGANVLVDKDGNCKLADFGSAKKIVEEKGHNDSIRGTPYWMAPETIKQSGSGRFADIWSIGCTVIEMATAKPPFADKTPIQAMFQIANATEPPPIPDHLSKECKDFISKCLSWQFIANKVLGIIIRISPSERYNIRQLLNHAFITGSKVQSQNQTHKLLSKITEETQDIQTTSPDRRNEFLKGESRGNTLFQADTLTEKTKGLSTVKTLKSQHSRIKKETDSEKSNDSLDRQGLVKGQVWQIVPQTRIIQARTTSTTDKEEPTEMKKTQSNKPTMNQIPNDYSDSGSNDESFPTKLIDPQQISNKKLRKSNTSWSRQESTDTGEQTLVGQILDNTNNSNTSSNNKRKSQEKVSQQIPLLSLFSKHQLTSGQQKQSISSDSEDNKSSNNQKQKKDTNKINGNDHKNKEPKSVRLETRGSAAKAKINKIGDIDDFISSSSSSSSESSSSSSHSSTIQDSVPGSHANFLQESDGEEKKQKKEENNNIANKNIIIPNKKFSLGNNTKNETNIAGRNNSNINNNNKNSNNNNSNNSNTNNNSNNNTNNKAINNGNQEQIQNTNISLNSFQNEDHDSPSSSDEFQYNQGAVDQMMRHQNHQKVEISQIRRNKRRHLTKPNEDKQNNFSKEKFGRLKFSQPTSPKLITQGSGGTLMNNCSFDQNLVESSKQGCVATSDTVLPGKVAASLNQVQINQYSAYFGQSFNSIQDDQSALKHKENQASIDGKLLSQFVLDREKNKI